MKQKVFKIKGVIQYYSWGGKTYIPQLLGLDNEEGKPFAEYWLGTHPKCPSEIIGLDKNLLKFIDENKVETLGESVAKNFPSLPFLFKVLDVRQMLSIQVHPGKKAAEAGFEEENKKGIDIAAPHRNYKDQNHKPELMIALSDFWLLHGLKKEEELATQLDSIPEFNFLKSSFSKGGYAALYKQIMELPQEKIDQILHSLMKRVIPLYENESLGREDANFWAARAALTFCKEECYDRGIFSIYFLNLLHLKKGEGVYQPEGMLHAYLEGQNIEIMANSDNVLRAGLTDKHVDVPELLKHVVFKATKPEILNPMISETRSFTPPVDEFALEQIHVKEKLSIKAESAEIYFVLNGEAEINNLPLKKGESLFVSANTDIHLDSKHGAEVFRAYVP